MSDDAQPRWLVTAYQTRRYDVTITAPTAADAASMVCDDIRADGVDPTSSVISDVRAQRIHRHEPGDPGVEDDDNDEERKPA